MEKTRIAFRKFEDGEVIAIFLEIYWDYEQKDLMSYMHTGQHGACSPLLLKELEVATSAEYSSLLQELCDLVGYKNIEIVE